MCYCHEHYLNFYARNSDKEENSEVKKGDKEEIKEFVKDNNEIEPTQCVSNARIICTNASSDLEPVYIYKENSKIYIEDFGQLNKTYIELEAQFKECTNPEANKKCSLIPKYILDKEWNYEDEEIAKLIQNSNSYVNPVFMASINVAESGSKGVKYNRKN